VISGCHALVDDTKNTNYIKDMSNTRRRRPQAVQAVLSRKNIEIFCTLVFEDESVSYPVIASVSVRGAQREITGRLVGIGYTPVGRWSDEGVDDDGYAEWTRSFKPGPNTSRIFMLSDLPMTDSRALQPEPK
jgi:hypothetical protein